jgi:dihydropteroate synthase type 2
VQRWALARGVAYVNDIHGFREPSLYPELARSTVRLVVMHAVGTAGRAARVPTDAASIFDRIVDFFAARVAALEAAGVARDRLVLDPGMGFFLGEGPEPSLVALRRLRELRARFDLPLWVSVSRKSFLGTLTGRDVAERGAATLAAELHAAGLGADYIRTHDVRALKDALVVTRALRG